MAICEAKFGNNSGCDDILRPDATAPRSISLRKDQYDTPDIRLQKHQTQICSQRTNKIPKQVFKEKVPTLDDLLNGPRPM